MTTVDDGAGARRSDKPGGGRGVDADSGDDWVGGATDGSKSGEAEARLRPAMASGMVPAGERAGEGKGKGRGREWMERVGQARALYITSVGEVAAMQAARASERNTRTAAPARCRHCCSYEFKFPILPRTYH